MSPKSRTRKTKSKAPQRRTNKAPANKAPANPLQELYRTIAPGVSEELDQTSPLRTEQTASDLYSMLHQSTNLGPGIDAGLFTDLVTFLERRNEREAAALLWALASVADAPADAEAAVAAQRMEDAGVEPPAWLAPLQTLTAAAAWQLRDCFGDFIQLVIEYRTGRRKHGMAMTIDTNHMGGYATDIGFADSATKMVHRLERTVQKLPGMVQLEPLDPGEAQRLGLAAIAATDVTSDPETGEGYDANRSLALRRLLAIGGGSGVVTLDEHRTPTEAEEQAAVRKQDRETEELVTEFVDDAMNPDTPGFYAQSVQKFIEQFARLAELAIDYGRNYDDGRLLRVSPVKLNGFVGGYLPRKVMLDDAEQEALPFFLDAWVMWCGERQRLSEDAMDIILQAAGGALADVDEAVASGEELRSPGLVFMEGIDTDSMEDMQDAMARRQLAMPYFGTRIGGNDYPRLNANDPHELRLLVLGELPTLHGVGPEEYPAGGPPDGSPVWEAALREMVVSQLWHNTPPQVWEAARRLQAEGQGRDEVLPRLAHVLAGHVNTATVSSLHSAMNVNTAVDIRGYAAALAVLGARGKGGHLRSV